MLLFSTLILQKNGDIDLDKNGNAFDSTMWCQAIWALKMITLIQSNLLRREFVCACVCVCLLPMSYERLFFQALQVCTGFSAFALCQFSASVLTVVTGLLIFISYSFVVSKSITWDLSAHTCCACVLCAHGPCRDVRLLKQRTETTSPQVTWTCQYERKFSALAPLPLNCRRHFSAYRACSSSHTLLMLSCAAALC